MSGARKNAYVSNLGAMGTHFVDAFPWTRRQNPGIQSAIKPRTMANTLLPDNAMAIARYEILQIFGHTQDFELVGHLIITGCQLLKLDSL